MSMSNKATVIIVGPREVADRTNQRIMAAGNLNISLVEMEDDHGGTPGVRRIELEVMPRDYIL